MQPYIEYELWILTYEDIISSQLYGGLTRGRLCYVYCPLENVYCPLDDSKMLQHAATTLQDLLRQRREAHCKALWQEVERLTQDALALGVQRVILFGSLV